MPWTKKWLDQLPFLLVGKKEYTMGVRASPQRWQEYDFSQAPGSSCAESWHCQKALVNTWIAEALLVCLFLHWHICLIKEYAMKERISAPEHNLTWPALELSTCLFLPLSFLIGNKMYLLCKKIQNASVNLSHKHHWSTKVQYGMKRKQNLELFMCLSMTHFWANSNCDNQKPLGRIHSAGGQAMATKLGSGKGQCRRKEFR